MDKEIIQLNEQTVWSGSPNRNDNPLSLDSLNVIRQLIFEGKQKDAERIVDKVIITKKYHGQKFEPVGSLQLAFDVHHNFSNYYRELDIERAVTKTSYTVGDVTYTREVMTSVPDRVVVMRLSASKPGSISFTTFFTTPQKRATIKTTPTKELTIESILILAIGRRVPAEFQEHPLQPYIPTWFSMKSKGKYTTIRSALKRHKENLVFRRFANGWLQSLKA